MSLLLRSVSTTSGHLSKAKVEFAEGLTCIIGARGTCKSTLVETLRFIFDADPLRLAPMIERASRSNESSQHGGLLAATLGDGTASCTALGADGSTLIIERDIGSDPQVLRDGVQQAAGIQALPQIEIYSQGDLQRIAEDPHRSLSLVDGGFQVRRAEIEKESDALRTRLREIGPRIRMLRSEIAAKTQLVAPMAAHRQSLKEIELNRPVHSLELAQEREKHMSRRSALETIKAGLDSRATLARNLESLDRNVAKLMAASKALSLVGGGEAAAMAGDFTDISHALSVLRQKLQGQTAEALDLAFERVSRLMEGLSTRYHALRREQEAVNESLRKEETLRAEIQNLERIEQEIGEAKRELDAALTERRSVRLRVEELANELFLLRDAEISGIETSFGSRICLTLRPAANSAEIVQVLKEKILPGSNVRNQEDVAREVAERIKCSDLIDIVESGDVQQLGSLLDRDATRLMAHLVEHARLYELDGVLRQDILDIEMMVHGVRKPIGELSKGQMATALLPLILRNAEYPLVFDQPEDDLDNAYISESLIEGIKHVKKKRQLIFVTHNANIPVLGDAERIIVMEMTGHSSAAVSMGTVPEMREQIISLLEGGRDAFRRRGVRYGDVVDR